MDGKRLIERIRLRNFLSFGPESEELALGPLNLVIGPNSSGKSNFLMAFQLLEALPQWPIRSSGGMSEFLWKGGDPSSMAEIDATISYPPGSSLLRYRLCFGSLNERIDIVDESISEIVLGQTEPEYLFRRETGTGLVEIASAPMPRNGDSQRTHEMLPRGSINTNQSILGQFREPVRYPELTYLADRFKQIGLYIEGWRLHANDPPKSPVGADEGETMLAESGRNLALVLSRLFEDPAKKTELLAKLKLFNERVDDVTLVIRGGVVGIQFHERGLDSAVSARRMSDGALRFLMLLAILCDSEPPPLVCLDEPEHGLHPDAMRLVADLLREASQRCQLIVTTHSDVLVSALSDAPDAVLVCERDEAGTRLHRLDGSRLTAWLEEYTLGDLWQMGEIGGRQ